MIELVVNDGTGKNIEETIEATVVEFKHSVITDLRDINLMDGHKLIINGKEETVGELKYGEIIVDEKMLRGELIGFKTLKSGWNKDVIETIYQITKTGQLKKLFSKRIYNNGEQS